MYFFYKLQLPTAGEKLREGTRKNAYNQLGDQNGQSSLRAGFGRRVPLFAFPARKPSVYLGSRSAGPVSDYRQCAFRLVLGHSPQAVCLVFHPGIGGRLGTTGICVCLGRRGEGVPGRYLAHCQLQCPWILLQTGDGRGISRRKDRSGGGSLRPRCGVLSGVCPRQVRHVGLSVFLRAAARVVLRCCIFQIPHCRHRRPRFPPISVFPGDVWCGCTVFTCNRWASAPTR